MSNGTMYRKMGEEAGGPGVATLACSTSESEKEAYRAQPLPMSVKKKGVLGLK